MGGGSLPLFSFFFLFFLNFFFWLGGGGGLTILVRIVGDRQNLPPTPSLICPMKVSSRESGSPDKGITFQVVL